MLLNNRRELSRIVRSNPLLAALRPGLRCLAASITLILGIQASSAPAQIANPIVEVETWSTTWAGFTDDFADGSLPDGSPQSEAIYYLDICGSTNDIHESAGVLTLTSPQDFCPVPDLDRSSTILISFLVPSESTVRATFRLPAPQIDHDFGVGIGRGILDFANLKILRNPSGIFVALATDEDPFAVTLFTNVTQAEIDAAQAIEFKLELVINRSTNRLTPIASYRLCQSSPCEAESVTGFTLVGLPQQAGSPLNGSLDSSEANIAALFATKPGGPSTFAYQVEGWSIQADATDDFEDAVFGAEAPYRFDPSGLFGSVNDVTQSNGRLQLGDKDTPGTAVRTGLGNPLFLGGLPGETDTTATFAWNPLSRCSSFGIGQVAVDPFFDFLNLSVVRSQNLDDPAAATDALYVWLQSETETGNTFDDLFSDAPILQRATISTDPDNDPQLVGLTAVELSLGLVASGAGPLLPNPSYRLCNPSGCGLPIPLLAHSMAADPTRQICGENASFYDPPADGTGQIDSLQQIGAELFAVPEPGLVAANSAALGTLFVLIRSRRRRAIR